MELNKEQLIVERFFYDEIIRTDFVTGQSKIKELGKAYSIQRVNSNGDFNIMKNDTVIAEFTSKGLEFK